jgi:hypothetical protein
MMAFANPLLIITSAKPTKTVTIAVMPYSFGNRRRAITMDTRRRTPCSPTVSKKLQRNADNVFVVSEIIAVPFLGFGG